MPFPRRDEHRIPRTDFPRLSVDFHGAATFKDEINFLTDLVVVSLRGPSRHQTCFGKALLHHGCVRRVEDASNRRSVGGSEGGLFCKLIDDHTGIWCHWLVPASDEGMNEKEDFFEVPKRNSERQSARKRGIGFLTHFFWMVLLGFITLAVVLLLVKVTGNGPTLKRSLIALLGGDAPALPAKTDAPAVAPPAAAEPLVIEKIVEVPVEKIVEKIVEVPPPLPSGYVSWRKVDVGELWSEIPVKTEVVTVQGDTAVKEREQEGSYQLEMKLKLTVPKPSTSAAELTAINDHLPKMLKDFDKLIAAGEVSPFFHHLYELKTARIQQKITRIDEILSRHNLYDLETALQIKHPETGRKLLLVQGEMDVVSDGSDGDRWPELDDYISMSQHYQPFTSYGWGKRSKTPNPLLSRWEGKLKEYEDEFALPGLSIERNRFLRSQIDQYKLEVSDMRSRSYLIAEADPFIVIPLSFLGRTGENEFGPSIGDYAVVIYENQLLPAIAGDGGPSWKFGEASLRVAQHLNEKATAYNRPVSDLKVTYLIFPGSAEPTKGPPDLALWHERCSTFLGEIGGIGDGYSLHQWEDLIAKKKAEVEAAAAAAAEAAKDTGTAEPPVDGASETPAAPKPPGDAPAVPAAGETPQ
jgi:hypothetical protein